MPYYLAQLDGVLNDPALGQFARECVGAYADAVIAGEALRLASGLKLCESPIEMRLAIAMTYMDVPLYFEEAENRAAVIPQQFNEQAFRFRHKQEGVEIYPQAQLGDYRVDFLIAALFEGRPAINFLVIECDGHDFHERTKEQARRDRSRDRDLLIGDYRVMRFTGSEIFRDAERCAADISEYLCSLEYQQRPA